MKSVRILIIEDSDDDAFLIIHELKRGGFNPEYKIVYTASSTQKALLNENWDIVTSDHSMPSFSAPEALNIVQTCCPEVPVIIVSGEIDINLAVSLMKKGARDYVQKHDLARLPLVVERELKEAANERQHRVMQTQLQEARELYKSVIEAAPSGVAVVGANGILTYVSPKALEMFGYRDSDQVLGRFPLENCAPEDRQKAMEQLVDALKGNVVQTTQYNLLRKDGTPFSAEINAGLLKDDDGRTKSILILVNDITARTKAEKDLQESQERWRFAIEGAGDGLWDWDLRTGQIFYSQRWREMMGYTDFDSCGRRDDWRKRIHPEDLADCDQAMQLHLDGNSPLFEKEYRMLCSDGGYKWLLSRGKVMERDLYGHALRVISTDTDITARRHTEESLRFVSEMISDMVFYADFGAGKDVAIEWQYGSRRQVLGYSINEIELMGGRVLDLVHPDDRSLFNSDIALLKQNNTVEGRCRVFGRDSHQYWIYYLMRPSWDFNTDTAAGLYGAIKDISSEIEMSEALRENEEMYRDLFENAADIVYIHDMEGKFLKFNNAAEKFLGYSPDELNNVWIEHIVAGEYIDQARTMIKAKLEGVPETRYELDIIAKDGHRHRIDLHSRIMYKKGKPAAVQGIARPICRE